MPTIIPTPTPTPRFTGRQMTAFRAFREVRDSRAFNMWSAQAAEAAGITKEEQLFVIKNFAALEAQDKEHPDA